MCPASLPTLPFELQECVLHHLPIRELLRAQAVCTTWYDISRKALPYQLALFFISHRSSVISPYLFLRSQRTSADRGLEPEARSHEAIVQETVPCGETRLLKPRSLEHQEGPLSGMLFKQRCELVDLDGELVVAELCGRHLVYSPTTSQIRPRNNTLPTFFMHENSFLADMPTPTQMERVPFLDFSAASGDVWRTTFLTQPPTMRMKFRLCFLSPVASSGFNPTQSPSNYHKVWRSGGYANETGLTLVDLMFSVISAQDHMFKNGYQDRMVDWESCYFVFF